MADLLYKQESYNIIGSCMDVYNVLGKGFLEIVYKDALAYEFGKKKIPFEREKEYLINYKDVTLPHSYFADFIVYDKIIIELKSKSSIAEEHVAQTLNYLAVSKLKLAIIINFGESSLKYKRVLL
jgi:GxxExxY protein